jgi:hypothetical protein
MLLWLQAFAAPAIFFAAIALFVYSKAEKYAGIAIGLLIVGGIAGIIVAEYIRRKIGLDTFFGRLYGSSGTEEKNKAKDKEQQNR